MSIEVHNVFCDDIRYELGGKITLVGTFAGIIVVPSFPVLIPRLSVCVSVAMPIGNPPKSLAIKVFLGRTEIYSHTYSQSELSPIQGFPPEIEGPEDAELTQMALSQYFSLPEIKVEGPQSLTVKVYADGKEYKGASLYFSRRKEAP